METIERDYSPKGVKFFYIYKALAHPEMNGYVTPFSLQERLLHIAEAKKQLGSRITWLCDSMENDLKHALGNAPNSEFVLGPDGSVIHARRWSTPDQLRANLANLVGEVTPATTVKQVGMSPLAAPKTAAKGVVPRLQMPGGMVPVQVQPLTNSEAGSETFYVKLRAEVEQSYSRDGEGKLYLGFFLDPLYKVHWNNRTMPVEYEIESPSSVRVEPATGCGPEVKEDADADPREFLIDLHGRSNTPISVTVKYFACDDAETFCKPVTQQYMITLERDPDGGSRRSPGGRSATAGRQRPNSGFDRERMVRMMARIPLIRALDADGNGEISQAEMQNAVPQLKTLDRDGDGQLSPDELRPRMNMQQPARNQTRRTRGG